MEEVKITEQHADRVQIMRTWSVEAPDWTPWCKTRAIAPRTVSIVWVDGVVDRIAVTGPYRLKSGKVAEPKFTGDQSHIGGTGDRDYRVDRDRMSYYNPRRTDDFPRWIPQFIADHAPDA